MEFFDAHIVYGTPNEKSYLRPVHTIADVKNAMAGAGIGKALVRRVEQFYAGAATGNRLLARDIKNSKDFWGIWSILPEHTHEIPGPDTMLHEMKKNRIACWQFFPGQHQFIFHHRTLKSWFELAQDKSIPIFAELSSRGIGLRELLDVLERFPHLSVILSYNNTWPCDRMLRPVLKEFPNVFFELSNYLADGGIEDLVKEGMAQRLLFGSRFYESHFGQMMLVLKHAGINETEKTQIASGTLERIIGKIQYD